MMQLISDNGFVAGGMVLMMLGSALTLAYRVIPLLVRTVVRRFTVSLEVRNREVFGWIGDWLASAVDSTNYRRLSVELLQVSRDGDAEPQDILVFAPGLGRHVVRHRGRWLVVEREREEQAAGGAPRPLETYTIRAAGADPGILKEFVREAGELHEQRRRGRTAVYCLDRYDGWRNLDLQERRPLAAVVLKAGLAERVQADLEAFLASGSWYRDMGIPHRRGYLFHGPPGCGKTSFAEALAGAYSMDLYLLSIGGPGMNDERLAIELSRTRPGSIVLLEDVDSAFAMRTRDEDNNSRVTFSGLLNAMDGVAAAEHRVVIMTTNHVDRLDPALIRPGRVDLQAYFGHLDYHQAVSLFLRFFPGEQQAAHAAAAHVSRGNIAPAHFQNLLLRCRSSVDDALAAINELQSQPRLDSADVAVARDALVANVGST